MTDAQVEPAAAPALRHVPPPAPSAFLARALGAAGLAPADADPVAELMTEADLTGAGAHGIFKTSRLEQLFRDGALGPLHPPPSDFCLYNMGLYELGLDPADTLPPLKPG